MRTNIESDHALMAEALKASGCKSKRASVEEGLRQLIRTRQHGCNRKLHWEGSLDEMQRNRMLQSRTHHGFSNLLSSSIGKIRVACTNLYKAINSRYYKIDARVLFCCKS